MQACIDSETARDMSTTIDPLRTTAQDLHRFWFTVATLEQWYAIMRECRSAFGSNWRAQSKIRRRLDARLRYAQPPRATLDVWFDIPDARFATWISIKLGVRVTAREPKNHK